MIARFRFRSILGTALVAVLCAACASEPSPRNVEVTHDGLVRVANSRVERAWIKPDVDFSQYTEVALLDAFVSFRRNWRMNHSGVRRSHMTRIKTTLAEEFRRAFTDALQSGGYPVVTDAADHVLLIRPAIINLDVAAPDTMSAGRSQSFTASPGSMTLVIELYDSVSSEILARAIDRRRARNVGNIQLATSGSNREAARRILRRWANLLVSRLDEVHHGNPGG